MIFVGWSSAQARLRGSPLTLKTFKKHICVVVVEVQLNKVYNLRTSAPDSCRDVLIPFLWKPNRVYKWMTRRLVFEHFVPLCFRNMNKNNRNEIDMMLIRWEISAIIWNIPRKYHGPLFWWDKYLYTANSKRRMFDNNSRFKRILTAVRCRHCILPWWVGH